MPTPRQVAAQFIAIIRKGFNNEFHWQRWLDKHRSEIDALPVALRKAVLREHENATAKVFCK